MGWCVVFPFFACIYRYSKYSSKLFKVNWEASQTFVIKLFSSTSCPYKLKGPLPNPYKVGCCFSLFQFSMLLKVRKNVQDNIRIYQNICERSCFFCFPFMPLQSGRSPSKHNTVWVGMRTMFVLPISSNKMRSDLITSGKISKDRIDRRVDRRVDSILYTEKWKRDETERESVSVYVCVPV